MLEITGDDIAALNDEDLRSLIGLLCESELRARGLTTSAVTWGGNQNAADGGIDVRVRIEDGEPPGGFVPRTNVGFQVKKTDFTPRLIGPEMRPTGQLRDSISSLIDENGAYIIASSGSNASDSALDDRLETMRSAVADNPRHLNLHLGFYDRNQLATWTRSHPGLVVWVRQKIGRGISGWQPYSSWATSPDGVLDEYLLDDKCVSARRYRRRKGHKCHAGNRSYPRYFARGSRRRSLGGTFRCWKDSPSAGAIRCARRRESALSRVGSLYRHE
jgi:hypothetical protein